MQFKDIDSSILKSLPNPNVRDYQIMIEIPECTFLGVKNQPDFAKLTITLIPDKHIVELKSLKEYVYQLREIIVSYERLLGILFMHLLEVYQPKHLAITMQCNPRGGISSTLTMESS